ncbi:MAG TPA: RHS repeat domain-containing protein [Oculatellaceae cyanobacterium]
MQQGVKADGSPLTDADREALKFKGLTKKEIQQFKTAQDISDHMRDLLRRANRLDNSLPDDFKLTSFVPADHWRPPQPERFQMPEVHDRQIGRNGTWSGRTADGLGISGRKDGSVTISDTANNTVRTYDKEGKITEAIDGVNRRTYKYDDQGQLVKVQYPDGVSLNKEDGAWFRSTRQGTYSHDEIVREDVQAQPNGDIRYVNEVDRSIKVEHPDRSVERFQASGRRDWVQADLPTEKAKFNELLANNFSNPEQLERVQKLMSEFEAEADKRGFYDNKRALFYKQINRLLADDPNAVIPQAERAALAEQVINHATHPPTVDQGSNSTCNVTTLEARNFVRDPEKNAQLLADIATTGQFTATDGSVIDLRDLQSGTHPDAEARKNMRLQAGMHAALKEDGSRDFASQLIELGMVNAKWQTESSVIVDGREADYWNTVYTSDKKLRGTLKNYKDVTELYNKDHVQLMSYHEGDVVYTKSGKEIKIADPESVVFRGGYALLTKEKNLTEVFTATGGRFDNFSQGARGFDRDGNEIMTAVKPGEIRYDKEIGLFGEKERVYYNENGEWKPLKDRDGDVMDSPNIYGNELEGINRKSIDTRDSGYYIGRGDFANVADFEQHLAQLKENNNFPAVAGVFTGNRPFSSGALSRAWGDGGYHVVNIQDYDPVTHTIYFTNQWGSGFDHMDKGVSVEAFYKGMEPSKLQKYLHDHDWQRYLYQGALTTAAGGAIYAGTAKVMDLLRSQQSAPTYPPQPAQPSDQNN